MRLSTDRLLDRLLVPTFNLAHISDLHFSRIPFRLSPIDTIGGTSSYARARAALSAVFNGGRPSLSRGISPSTFSPDVAQRLARKLSEELLHLDALVVTGDLATTGHDEDLTVAKNFFFGQVPPAWNPLGTVPPLAALPYPVVTLPGNHDRYEGVALQPASRAFERFFGEGWDMDAHRTFSVSGASGRTNVLQIEKGEHALILCLSDFSLFDTSSGEGAWGWVGQGRAEDALLRDLVRTTRIVVRDAESRGLVAVPVWAVHFPPGFPGIESSLELLGSEHLVRSAHDVGVGVILAGHTHQALNYRVDRDGNAAPEGVLVICSGASAGISGHDQYSFATLHFDVRTDGLASLGLEQFNWDAEEFRFRPAARVHLV